jgi:formate/nitrite transporter FocA (FNT family)
MIKTILKSILAGVLIALAGIVYLSCIDKVVGSFLFSFGLCLVIILEANLYTGKVGYVNSKQDVFELVLMLMFNIVGAFVVGLLCHGTYINDPVEIVTTKIQTDLFSTLLKSVGCGICIYGAVEGYKKTKSFVPVILGVMVFILAGFNHVVADAFYIGAAILLPELNFASGIMLMLSLTAYLFLVATGNAIGSILIRLLQKG